MTEGPEEPAALFATHLDRTESFSDDLYAIHCRRTGRFDGDLRATLSVFGPLMSAWNAEILFVLRFHGPQRFNRILDILSPISPRVLTDKLRHLEAHGFLTRNPHDDHVLYSLTEHGLRTAKLLHPLLYYLRNHGRAPAEGITTPQPNDRPLTRADAGT